MQNNNMLIIEKFNLGPGKIKYTDGEITRTIHGAIEKNKKCTCSICGNTNFKRLSHSDGFFMSSVLLGCKCGNEILVQFEYDGIRKRFEEKISQPKSSFAEGR